MHHTLLLLTLVGAPGRPGVELRATPAQPTTEAGLFGLIIERGARFRFVSYANQLD